YHVGKSRVLWSFEEVTVELTGQTSVTNLGDGTTFTASEAFVLPRHSVVWLNEAPSPRSQQPSQ
ncbi:MAG TPA: hypothetical protein VF719_05030, partial [Abditibacteriaceae bacterium]